MSQTKETVLSDYIDFIANRILISIKEEEYMFKACIKDDQKNTSHISQADWMHSKTFVMP